MSTPPAEQPVPPPRPAPVERPTVWADEGGDPACWLAGVCPDCGRITDGDRGGACPSCGSTAFSD